MIKAIETVTVVNHTLDGDDDIFRCTVVRGASWYWQNNVSVSESGLNSARLLKCRIPAGNVPEGLTVNPGDKIVLGALESVSAEEFGELAHTHESATVLDVHWNLFGVNRHIYIEGA